MKKGWALAALLVVIWLPACSGIPKQVTESVDRDQTLAFGYVDMGDAPVPLKGMTIKQVKPRTETPYFWMRVHEGAFYNENFKPGSYQMNEFWGQNCLFGMAFPCGVLHRFQFPPQRDGFRLEKPGLYFLGSYRYKHINHFFREDQFSIEPVNGPSEADVLRMILPQTEGTVWKARIEARLRELSR